MTGSLLDYLINAVQLTDNSSKMTRCRLASAASGATVLLKGADTVVAGRTGGCRSAKMHRRGWPRPGRATCWPASIAGAAGAGNAGLRGRFGRSLAAWRGRQHRRPGSDRRRSAGSAAHRVPAAFRRPRRLALALKAAVGPVIPRRPGAAPPLFSRSPDIDPDPEQAHARRSLPQAQFCCCLPAASL